MSASASLASKRPGGLRGLWARIRPGRHGSAGPIIALTIAIFLVPLLVDLALSPKLRPFGYATSDTFYYLALGRNFAKTGRGSFDGQFPTDGFHPLWFLVVGGFYFVCDLLKATRHFVLEIILLSAALIALGIQLLGRAMQDKAGRLPPFFLLVPVGVYSLVVAPVWLGELARLPAQNAMEGPMPLYGTLWSYANGMETPLAILAFGLAAWLFCRRSVFSGRNHYLLGLTLGALSLARLDYVLIAAPIAAGVCVSGWARRAWRAKAVAFGLCSAAPMVGFFVVNWLRVGHLFPVSAAMKSTFPKPTWEHVENVKALWELRKDGIDLLKFHREAAMVIPFLACLVFLPFVFELRAQSLGVALRVRESAPRFDRFLGLAAPGVIALSLYDFFFVQWWGIGHWYFGVPTLWVSLASVSLLGRLRWRLPFASGRARTLDALASFARIARIAALGVFAAGVSALSVAFFLKLHRHPAYHEQYARFYWEEAPIVLRKLHGRPPKLLEFDDGIVGYSLGAPAMSGLGVALDPIGHGMHGTPAFLELAVSRGYDTVTTLVYQPHPVLDASLPMEGAVRGWATSMGAGAPDRFNVSVTYSSPTFTLVRLSRR